MQETGMYDRYSLDYLYADEPRLAREPAPRTGARESAVNDRVLEAFSRWLEGMEEALNRRLVADVPVRPRFLPFD
jgi:hypothetical protein